MKQQLIRRNPADACEPPRPARRKAKALDVEASDQLLKAARGGNLYLSIALAMATGFRRGEVLALRWCDVDLQAGTATVAQAVECTSQGHTFKPPKTEESARTIQLPE